MKLPTSILKPEGSIVAGIATAALVVGVYQLNVGSTAVAAATDAHDPALQSARKKASLEAGILVSAVSLLAKDVTIFILGGLTMVAYDWHLRHAIASAPQTGQLVDNNGYAASQNVVPMIQQGQAVGGY